LEMGGGYSVDQIPDQSGKVAIVTGANTGIGLITVRELARRGARVILACRSEERGRAAVEQVVKEAAVPADRIEFMQLDLASLRSVEAFVQAFLAKELPLHLLINNAGVMMTPFGRTVDGLEMQFGTNHVGHFLLTTRLLEKLQSSAPSRVVALSSSAHQFPYSEGIRFDRLHTSEGYGPIGAYGQSKLANLLFATELSRRLGPESNVRVNAVHPGYVATELQRSVGDSYGFGGRVLGALGYAFAAKTPENGALTTLYAATSPDLDTLDLRGRYFTPYGKDSKPSTFGRDAEMAKRLWDVTQTLVDDVLAGRFVPPADEPAK